VNVAGLKHRPVPVGQPTLVEPAKNSTLAIPQLLAYVGVHSKSFSVAKDDALSTSSNTAETKGFRVFFKNSTRRSATGSLG
jgi:hypothetical protein